MRRTASQVIERPPTEMFQSWRPTTSKTIPSGSGDHFHSQDAPADGSRNDSLARSHRPRSAAPRNDIRAHRCGQHETRAMTQYFRCTFAGTVQLDDKGQRSRPGGSCRSVGTSIVEHHPSGVGCYGAPPEVAGRSAPVRWRSLLELTADPTGRATSCCSTRPAGCWSRAASGSSARRSATTAPSWPTSRCHSGIRHAESDSSGR
jgi:hypothetical protein